MTIWKTVPDYPAYEASNEGEIRNKKTGRILKKQNDIHGYYSLTLRKDNKQYPVRVHRAIASSFYPDSDKSLDVNHIDGDKHNNNIENLEFCTRKENVNHAFRTGLRKPRSMIPVEVIETGEIYPSIRECARKGGYDHSAICKCLSGKQDNYRGYHFKRKE